MTSTTRPVRARRAPRLRFATQVLILQLAVVSLVVGLCTALFAWLSVQQLAHEAESTSLAIAQAVAEDIDVRAAVATHSAQESPYDLGELRRGRLQSTAESIRERTGALFVVIADDEGIRLAHPDPALLGEKVSTSPAAALRGEETVSWATGTLGESARAKVPVYAPQGASIVGEVSVGFARAHVFDSVDEDAAPVVGVGILALLIGLVASLLIGRRLKRLTLGLQPEQLTTLVQDREAVLSGVGEGVIGLSVAGRVTVCNDRAERLLGLHRIGEIPGGDWAGEHGGEVNVDLGDALGLTLDELGAPARLQDIVRSAADGIVAEAETLVVGDKVLFVDVRRVAHDGHDLGLVIIVRDRTDVEALTRRLDAVAALTTALRAQRHEFANRLHTISGLLAIGETDEAQDYLGGILEHGPLTYPVGHVERVTEPYLQAFVGAKGIEAAEKGVSLRIGPETEMGGALQHPEDVTTVLGNLLDNAVSAAIRGANEPRWVELEFIAAGDELHVSVMDSGDGVAPSAGAETADDRCGEGRLFEWRTAGSAEADGDRVHGLGFGLPLSREIARRRGGEVWLASSGREGEHGAVFCARIPGVVTTAVAHTGHDASATAEKKGRTI